MIGPEPDDVEYLGSQPWPFPCSLMLGYHAWASQTEITVDGEEIAEARRLFVRHNWPVIDVTRRSIEETAATIIQLYNQRHGSVHL